MCWLASPSIPVLPPLEAEPARELLVLVVGLGDLALAANLGSTSDRRAGAASSGRSSTAPRAWARRPGARCAPSSPEPAVADELRRRLGPHGRGSTFSAAITTVVAFLTKLAIARRRRRRLRLPELALERVRTDDDFRTGEAANGGAAVLALLLGAMSMAGRRVRFCGCTLREPDASAASAL